jgi:septum formation protein
MTESEPLFLASASPRRRQMLTLLGIPFIAGVSSVDEDAAEERYRGPVEGLAEWLAKHKAAAALALPEAQGRLVITADTTVLLNDIVLGKPRNGVHARELLLALRGRTHYVVTGVAVSGPVDGKFQMRSGSCITPVRMRAYSEAEIAAYIATGDPMDKAGGYGIQHPSFQPTERIDGCYLNVVGLPLCVLVDLLAEFNVYPRVQPRATTACPWSEKCRI